MLKTCYWCGKWKKAARNRNVGVCNITQRPTPGPNECRIGEWEARR